MSRVLRSAAGTGATALALALMCLAAPGWVTPSSAQRIRALSIAVGETGALADPAVLAPALRAALADELSGRPDLRLVSASTARYVVRGSVTRLERSGAGDQVSCEVSLVVAEGRGGAIRAMLRGRASAQGAPSAALDRAVLRAAVRGALRPLGENLRPPRS